MKATVIIPWWDGGIESRRQNLRCVIDWYKSLNLSVILSDGSNRGTAKNNGAASLAATDVLVFGDADIIAECDLGTAIATACRTNRLVYPYNQLIRLNEQETRNIWAGEPIRFRHAGSGEAGLMAITKQAFDRIGGFPDLPGPGEDTIFYVKAEALLGKVIHQSARAVHLWHEGSFGTERQDKLNMRVPSLYIRAHRKPDQVRKLMARHG